MVRRALLLVMLMLPLLAHAAFAIPPMPHEFHGIVVIDRQYAPVGTLVEVWDTEGVRCGSFALREPGFYGSLSCRGDDLTTAVDEGPRPGETVRFIVEGVRVETASMLWESGGFGEVNLLLGPVDGLELIRKPARVSTDMSHQLNRLLLFSMLFALTSGLSAWLVLPRGGRHD